jgi:hypothetical protein
MPAKEKKKPKTLQFKKLMAALYTCSEETIRLRMIGEKYWDRKNMTTAKANKK